MTDLKDLILKLTTLIAPSGSEKGIQETLLDLVKDVSDEVFVDTLGNGVAVKRGQGPHVMLSAHADEVGVMVIHIEDNGFLRVIPVGQVKPATLIGRHVQFTDGVVGIVGVESKVKLQEVNFDSLYIDIAANDAASAAKKVKIGSEAVVIEPVVALDEHHLAGRALDNRAGCAIAISAFRTAAEAGRNVSLVFTAQQTVGARGAKTVAFRLQPDLALVIDAVPAGDMPKAPRMSVTLGKGPAIKIMDGTAIVPLAVKSYLIQQAEQLGLTVQYEVWPGGLSDAGSIHQSADGILMGGISYPARYVGGPSTLIDLRDVEAALQLTSVAVLNYTANA
jgi:tetrahedral aminopeptidase